ncbi:hypothetical protein FQN54_001813 [Arachnomyces sp. PD_36]|nr:hypothetical protein FQN54_001813 [Arachnomyces sp. PD_36]
MTPSSSRDLLEHFRQDVVVTSECAIHIEYRSDQARGIRKEKVEKRWDRKQRIGFGSYGEVWLEVNSEKESEVEKRAVKVIDKGRLESLKVDFRKELLALAKFSKPQYQQEGVLVEFIGWYEDPLNLYLFMEYFELGDLERHITPDTPITESDVKAITTDILSGLRIMHDENFAHRDLKPSNIFVVQKPPDSKWWIKIGDFGISKRVEGDETALRTQIGSLHYQAPEITGDFYTDEPTSTYDKAVDMWSLGCVIYKIATQNIPFPNARTIMKFCDKQISFPEAPLLEKFSTEGVGFVKRLIVPDPRERLSTTEALEDPWLLQGKEGAVPQRREPTESNARVLSQTAEAGYGGTISDKAAVSSTDPLHPTAETFRSQTSRKLAQASKVEAEPASTISPADPLHVTATDHSKSSKRPARGPKAKATPGFANHAPSTLGTDYPGVPPSNPDTNGLMSSGGEEHLYHTQSLIAGPIPIRSQPPQARSLPPRRGLNGSQDLSNLNHNNTLSHGYPNFNDISYPSSLCDGIPQTQGFPQYLTQPSYYGSQPYDGSIANGYQLDRFSPTQPPPPLPPDVLSDYLSDCLSNSRAPSFPANMVQAD